MNVPALNQRDPRWSSKKLGRSTKYTIGTHGCTLTCLTMFLNSIGYAETPDTVNENLKRYNAYAADQFGQVSLIIWGRIAQAYPKVKFDARLDHYNNYKVATYIYVKGLPVLVEVNARSIGAPRHWVLYTGFRKCNDPWVGKAVPTNTYPAIGAALLSKTK